MKRVFFLGTVLLATFFAEAKTLSKESLDGVIRDVVIPHLSKDKRVNPDEVENFLILSTTPLPAEGVYSADVSISEIDCDIVFKFYIQLIDSAGKLQPLITEKLYERNWRRHFLLNYRGPSKLVPLDSVNVDFSRWKDPAGESVKKMFFDLLKQNFQLDSKNLQGFRIKNEGLYQKYALINKQEEAFICNGRSLSIEAREIEGRNVGANKMRNKYKARFFVYKNYDGAWSSDSIGLEMKNEPF